MAAQTKKEASSLKEEIGDQYLLYVFDFDGTIVKPLQADFNEARRRLQRQLGQSDKGEIRLSDLLRQIIEQQGESGKQKAFSIVEEIELAAVETAELKKEVIDFINSLPTNKTLAIFSVNMRETIDRVLERERLKAKFTIIVSKEDVIKYKPDPEGLLKILAETGISREETVFIGDNEISDLLAGQAAKVETYLV